MRRAQLAIVACVLWLVGFEGLPALHLATHDDAAPHVHAADGTVIHVSFGTHRHADGSVHADHDLKEMTDGHVRHSHSHDPGVRELHGHADGAIGHRGIAAIPSPPPITKPLPIDRRPTIVAAIVAATPISASTPVAAARGPPSFSFVVS
jgi:hypothetical protein